MARQRIKPGPQQLSSGALPLSYPSRTSLSKVHVQEVPIITAAIHGGLGNTKSTLPPCRMVVHDGYLHLVTWL